MIHTLLIILLLEGFITISVEILTMRQLLPFFGGSVLITSLIIGVFLLFLALGYWRGGIYESAIFRRLSRNFTLALIWIGLGLNYPLIALFFYLSTSYFHLAFLVSLSCYLLLVLAPIVYWLGQTIPLTTNLFNQTLRVSDISGRALFISTLGSFLGALLTALVLFQYLGVAWTLVINCCLLFFLILFIRPHARTHWSTLLCLLGVVVFIKFLNIHSENTLFVKTNNYANYEVLTSPTDNKLLRINHSNSSLLTAERQGFPYIETIRNLLFNTLKLHHQHLLVIGAGGFTLTAAGAHDNVVTYVDIDPEIKSLAENYFLQGRVQGQFIGQDARAYLNQTKAQFDAILSDAYSNQAAIPPSLLTVDYFKALANHLKPSGILIVNLIHDPLFSDNYSRNVFSTIHAIFPYCTIIPIHWRTETLANMIYVCPNIAAANTVYTDNLNTATLDFFNSKRPAQPLLHKK